MKIALAQLGIRESFDENVQASLAMLEQAAGLGADLVCYPEVHLYPFFPQYRKRSDDPEPIRIDHPVLLQFQEKCRELKVMAIPNVYLSERNKNYDASIIINKKGEIMGVSKMVHIVQTEQFYEQDYYVQSEEGFLVYDTPLCKIGVVICFDRHFPESIRACVLKGAELIIIPTVNTKAEPSDMFEWELRVQAMHNSVFVAMCNRVGVEGKMDFSGESIIIDPRGEVVKKADDSEQLIIAELELKQVDLVRNKLPYLRLRRPDQYTQLVKN